MPFCKYCGKELEGDSLCTCVDALREEQERNAISELPEETADITDTETAVTNDSGEDPKTKTVIPSLSKGPAIRRVNTGVNDRKSNDDSESFKKFGALVAAVLVVFVIVLGCMAAGSGYKGTVRKYFKSRFSKHGGKTYYSLTLPDDGIAELKDNDYWQELVEDYNDDVENRMKDWDKKPKFRKISKVKDMKNSELKDAEKYFFNAAETCEADVDEDDIEVKKGYVVTYKFKNTEGDNEKNVVYVVKLKGEGWKVMNNLSTAFYGLEDN